PRDIAVLDSPGQLDLAAEPLERVVGQPALQDLERVLLVELGIERLVDAAHAAAAEPAHDLVAAGHDLALIDRRHAAIGGRHGAGEGVVLSADRHVGRSYPTVRLRV